MRMIMFAGAGSVGKTKLTQACVELMRHDLNVACHFSTTRKTYEKHGFTNESEALKDPETNSLFQHEVMQDNIIALQQAVKKAEDNKVDILFADRTPHDYAAYYFSVFPERLTLDLIEKKRHLADDALAELRRPMNKIDIVMLPFPAPWSVDTDSSDGWRKDTTGKNFIWSNILDTEINNIKRRLGDRRVPHYHINVIRMNAIWERATPDQRAVALMSYLL